MRALRVLLGVSLTVTTFVAWWRFEHHDLVERAVAAVSVSAAAGLLAALAGLAVWETRPDRSAGPLLTVSGATVMCAAFTGFTNSTFQIVAWVAWACLPLSTVHLLLAYPDGLSRRARFPVIATCWLVPAALGMVLLISADHWRPSRLVGAFCCQRPAPLAVLDQPAVAQGASEARWLWLVVVAVVGSAIALRRARAARGPIRASLLPVAWASVAWAIAQIGTLPAEFIQSDYFARSDVQEPLRLFGMVLPSAALLALGVTVVWVELVRPRLDPNQGGHIRLLGTALVAGEALRLELARTVGDPALRIAYLALNGQWFGANGRPTTLRIDRDRAVTSLTRDGVTVAAVEHDIGLRATPDLLSVATAMAGLAIDNDRLRALDAAQLDTARSSGARLLAAGERARQDLEAIVGQGPGARLTELAEAAVAGADPVELQRGLRGVVNDVRAISRRFAPPELADHGLGAALPDAALVPGRRFARPIELTAYLVAMGHPGARLDDDGDRLVISVAGFVPEEVIDRVVALAGTVSQDAQRVVITLPVEN